ncbi:MAG: hypothetical protein ACTS8S_00545 [Giesbergeria sp.]
MLSDDQILSLAHQAGVKIRTGKGAIALARVIQAEVRKGMTKEAMYMEMAANAEANRVDELTDLRKQDTALIQQLVDALEDFDYDKRIAAIPAGRVRLEDAARDVLAERQRQISAEGWTPEHDDEHYLGELSQAAACYASQAFGNYGLPTYWPWAAKWWKPSKDPRRNLIKAGALILAEIERMDRAARKQGGA